MLWLKYRSLNGSKVWGRPHLIESIKEGEEIIKGTSSTELAAVSFFPASDSTCGPCTSSSFGGRRLKGCARGSIQTEQYFQLKVDWRFSFIVTGSGDCCVQHFLCRFRLGAGWRFYLFIFIAVGANSRETRVDLWWRLRRVVYNGWRVVTEATVQIRLLSDGHFRSSWWV